jgi:hypothetical protein
MSLSTILDSVPQLPGGAYVNHFAYGGALGLCIAVILRPWAPWQFCWCMAALLVFGFCAVKKVDDYIVKHETLSMCVGKTIVTALLPAIIYGATFLK